MTLRFQSTLPVWGATRWPERQCETSSISIHAPRVGSDAAQAYDTRNTIQFQSTLPVWGATGSGGASGYFTIISIHAPRVGSDRYSARHGAAHSDFNPRSPCGERLRRLCHRRQPRYFNPRSPCGERLKSTLSSLSNYIISIHAPRVGSDGWRCAASLTGMISIHAPRVGSDSWRSCWTSGPNHFNPRSPCGERQQVCTKIYLRICNMRESCVHFRRWY